MNQPANHEESTHIVQKKKQPFVQADMDIQWYASRYGPLHQHCFMGFIRYHQIINGGFLSHRPTIAYPGTRHLRGIQPDPTRSNPSTAVSTEPRLAVRSSCGRSWPRCFENCSCEMRKEMDVGRIHIDYARTYNTCHGYVFCNIV